MSRKNRATRSPNRSIIFERRSASNELRWIAEALSEARNLDVFASSVLAPARAALPAASEFERLAMAIDRRRILQLLAGAGLKRVLYVSCHPGSLARDLGDIGAHVIQLHVQIDVSGDQRDDRPRNERGEQARALRRRFMIRRLRIHVAILL